MEEACGAAPWTREVASGLEVWMPRGERLMQFLERMHREMVSVKDLPNLNTMGSHRGAAKDLDNHSRPSKSGKHPFQSQ